jgi:allantoin racemase
MRLLLYNPNTDKALTEKLAALARRVLRPNDSLEAVSADEGTGFIGSEETIEIARASLESHLERHARNSDAVLLGCFGDLGVDEVRERLRLPILSLSDAFFATAPFLGKKIGIITTSPFWADRLETEARQNRITRWIAGIRPLANAADRSSEALQEQCRTIVSEFARAGRCDLVVLAGAVLVAIAPNLAQGSPLPMADSLASAIALCRAAHESFAFQY